MLQALTRTCTSAYSKFYPVLRDITSLSYLHSARRFLSYSSHKMPSSKGKPTDPELREEIKEEIKQEPNKSGGGEGQWAAWKGAKLAKEYEKQGGGYENEAGSKNEPKKGEPEKKSESKKKAETDD